MYLLDTDTLTRAHMGQPGIVARVRQAGAAGKQGLSRLALQVLAPSLSGLRARLAPRPGLGHAPKRA